MFLARTFHPATFPSDRALQFFFTPYALLLLVVAANALNAADEMENARLVCNSVHRSLCAELAPKT